MNVEPARRDTAQLVAVAEAVAELADEHGHRELAQFASRAAARFQRTVMAADPAALAVHRYEAAALLRVSRPWVDPTEPDSGS